MANYLTFDDGSSIRWADRETLEYSEGKLRALIWVDFEPELFSGTRLIKASSIQKWESHPELTDRKIPKTKRAEILKKVQDYYESNNRKCRIEE